MYLPSHRPAFLLDTYTLHNQPRLSARRPFFLLFLLSYVLPWRRAELHTNRKHNKTKHNTTPPPTPHNKKLRRPLETAPAAQCCRSSRIQLRFRCPYGAVRSTIEGGGSGNTPSPIRPLTSSSAPRRIRSPGLQASIEDVVLARLSRARSLGCGRDWSRIDVRVDARLAFRNIVEGPIPSPRILFPPISEDNVLSSKAARAHKRVSSYDELIQSALSARRPSWVRYETPAFQSTRRPVRLTPHRRHTKRSTTRVEVRNRKVAQFSVSTGAVGLHATKPDQPHPSGTGRGDPGSSLGNGRQFEGSGFDFPSTITMIGMDREAPYPRKVRTSPCNIVRGKSTARIAALRVPGGHRITRVLESSSRFRFTPKRVVS